MSALHTTFNFSVVITLDDAEKDQGPLCAGAFAAVDGLEITMETKTLRSGGDNGRQVQLAGPVRYGTVTLKRGMTSDFGLWDWFESVTIDHQRHRRATCEIMSFAADRATLQATWILERCLPQKLRLPGLDARTGEIAVEELSLVHELLRLRRPAPRGGASRGAPAGAAAQGGGPNA